MNQAKNYFNVIHPCLLKEKSDALVIDVLPPLPLHLLIGATNAIMGVIIKLKGTIDFDETKFTDALHANKKNAK